MNRRILLIAPLVAVLVVAAWYVALFRPERNQLHTQQTRASSALTTRSSLDARLSELEAVSRDLQADQKALAKTVVAVPESVSIDTAIDQIHDAAVASGVQWTNESQSTSGSATGTSASGATTSTANGSTSGLSTVSMNLTVSGSYKAVTDFVSLIQQRHRLLVIDSLGFNPSAQSVTATIGARVFYDSTPLPKLSGIAPANG